ncbi:hypothetical protein [Granulicella mallensis]|uniref:Uncharacterized protein n=1 Tax=Granulicella mallensis (strain ATCC BAA-1857 / DSM 23137 / MP5ACTX8) TaxID=682795 RepID=G8NXM1_GRAMM|nr:hypothetical protein [Granulicella mallensis]AEU39016.1 hypothetical protein AciX8_4747 [Granulicella mallensis MP5ACTX8]
MGSLNLSSAVHVLPCPNCRETINTSVRQCPYCSALIDPAAAEVSAAATSRISAACSDASVLKIMAWMLVPFFFLQIVPFLGLAGVGGLLFLRVAIPAMAIRWWIRFGSIKTDDPDFVRAKRIAIIIGILTLLDLVDVIPLHGCA